MDPPEPMELAMGGAGRKPGSKQQPGEKKERVGRKDGHHRSGRPRRRDHSSPADSAGSRTPSPSEPPQSLREKTHHRKRRRRRSSSPSADSDLSYLSDLSSYSSSSESSPTRRRMKTNLKRLKKHKKDLKKKSKRTKKVMKHHKKRKKLMRKMKYGSGEEADREDGEGGARMAGPSSPEPSAPPLADVVGESSKKKRGPMTKEAYEKQQSIVRRVYDPDTGRHRLVKGDGEIIEEIVSKERHRAINKQATAGDGASFQAQLARYA